MTDNGIGKYYFYDLRGRLAKISSGSDGTGTQTLYTYDNYGNRISDGNRSYTWTRGRLLASAGSATYTYDHNGIRSKKVYGGKTTEYLYDGGKLLHESGGDSTITYFYDVEGINAASIDEQYLIVVTDLDGSVRYIAGSVGQIIAQYKYDAYGRCKVYKQDNTEDTDMSSLGNRFPLRWKGYYYDRETGLYYADGRYYDPEVGQYLDAIEIPEAISEKYLDRNGILCDNILELMPYMYSVLVNMAKDPACTDTEEGIPWWGWIFVGITVAAAAAVSIASLVLSAGSTSSLIAGGVKMLSSALIGGVTGGLMNIGAAGGYLAGFIGGFAGGLLSGGLGLFKRISDSLLFMTGISAISAAASSSITDSMNNLYLPSEQKLTNEAIMYRAFVSFGIGIVVGFGANALSIGIQNGSTASLLMDGWSKNFANVLALVISIVITPDILISRIFNNA